MTTVFLLSPAYCGGRRASIILTPDSTLPVAQRLRAGSLSLGEAFSFMSGLYFRGKLTYARRFARDSGTTLVITPTRGLLPPDTLVSPDLLREFAGIDIASDDVRYRQPLERDLTTLAGQHALGPVVLLGSVATGKYVDVLAGQLGNRLHFPSDFIGRGDMSRGGLLLRHAASGVELAYKVLEPGMPRRGSRPPRLDPQTRAGL
ncbi:MAG: hypothetical protein ABL986_10785 [Vicinamibacterales bacterium]